MRFTGQQEIDEMLGRCTDCKDRRAGRSRRITDRLKELNITLRGREEAFPGAAPSEYVQEANNGVN